MEKNKNDNSYEDCIKELMFRKKQLEAIKSSRLSIATHEIHYMLRQSAYNRSCLKIIVYRF
jgi:hypothetical protein